MEGRIQMLWHAYMSTQCSGHLALAAERLMQDTTRLGRWQLHQEVGPQQAKGAHAHRSCPDTRWSGGLWRLAGWQPREGGGAGGERNKRGKLALGECACLFSWGLTLCPPKHLIVRLRFCWFLRAVLVDIVVSQISIVVQKLPHRTATERAEPSGAPGCLC